MRIRSPFTLAAAAAAVLAGLALVAPAPVGATASTPDTGIDCAAIAADSEDAADVSIFEELGDHLPDDALPNLEPPLTLFVPSNAAFEAIPENVLNALIADTDLLVNIFGYHTTGDGALLTADLLAAGSVTTAVGGSLTFERDGDTVSINDGEAHVVCPDLTFPDDDGDNVVVHVIDAVLQPPSMTGGSGSSVPGSSAPGSSTQGTAAFDAEQQLVATAWETVVDSSKTYDEVAPFIDDADELRTTIEAYPAAAEAVGGITATVTSVTIVGGTAAIKYTVSFAGVEAPYGELDATLETDDGAWIVPQAEYCAVQAYARNNCPPLDD